METVIRYEDAASIKQSRGARIEDTVPDHIRQGALEWLDHNGEFTQESIDTLNEGGGLSTEATDQLATIIISNAKSSDKCPSIEQAIFERTGEKKYKQYVEAYLQCLTNKRNDSETLWEQYALEWLDHDGQFPQAIKDMFRQVGQWSKGYTDKIKQMIFAKVKLSLPDEIIELERKIFKRIEQNMPEDRKERNKYLRKYVEQSIKEITRD